MVWGTKTSTTQAVQLIYRRLIRRELLSSLLKLYLQRGYAESANEKAQPYFAAQFVHEIYYC